MRLCVGLLLIGLSVRMTLAQSHLGVTIQGLVQDSTTQQALPQATISLMSLIDSSVVKLQLADDQGNFTLHEINTGRYRIIVSYVGYYTCIQSVIVSTTSRVVDIGTLMLRSQTVRLQEVNVQHRIPVRVKSDTLEFDAGSFDIRPNTVVEDLLRKLPGLDVSGDGTVLAQGQAIQQVLVNGQPFFGADPRMATRNLPTDLIDKIQIFDKRSDKAAFSGVDDGNRSRTINIITKPEARQGQFGQQTASYGSDSRYQAGVSFNRFRNQQQLSLLGQSNNLNQIGYTLPTYNNGNSASSETSSTQGQPSGVTRSTGTSLNYTNRWGKQIDVAVNYSVLNVVTQIEETLNRRTLLPIMRYVSGTDSSQSALITNRYNNTLTHRKSKGSNLRLNYQLDSMNTIRFNLGLSGSVNQYNSTLTAQTSTDQSTLINQSLSENSAAGNNKSLTANMLWMHRFQRVGRTLSLTLNKATNRLVNEGTNQSINIYYIQHALRDSLVQNQLHQRRIQRSSSATGELVISFAEPLSSQQTVEVHYHASTNKSTPERIVFDVDPAMPTQEQRNAELSNEYTSSFISQQLGSRWQIRRPGYNCTIGFDAQQADLRSAYQTGINSINRQYINLLPSLVFQPQLASNQYLQVQYQTRITAPSVDQLQPVADVTNPLFVQMGNPNLRPEYTHAFTTSYNNFQTTTYRTVFAALTIGLTNHRIVTSTSIDSVGVQTIRPINANGYLTAGSMTTFGRSFTVGSIINKLNLTTNLNLIRGISYINEQRNHLLAVTAGQIVRLNTTLANSIEATITVIVNYQMARYSLQSQVNNQSLNTILAVGLYYPLPFGFHLATDFAYTTNAGRTAGYNQQYGLLNGYISHSFKQQQGELRIQVFDLLNQNRSLTHAITDTYVEDTQSKVLNRYVMISFVYNLRRFGSGKSL